MRKFLIAVWLVFPAFFDVWGAVDVARVQQKFADSIVKVVFELKYDEKGDAPGCIGVYCSSCGEFHERNLSQLLANKQSLEVMGFVVAGQEIIAPAILLEPEGVKDIFVIHKNKKFPARITYIYPSRMAIKLELAASDSGLQPLQFAVYRPGEKLYAYNSIREFGRWVSRCRSFVPSGNSTISEGQGVSYDLPANSLIINSANQPVGMVLNCNAGTGEQHWLENYKKWQGISIDTLAGLRRKLETHLQKSVFPATVFLREWKLSRRERLMNITPERELYSYVFAMPDGKVFMPLLTTPQQNSLIEKVVVHLPEGDQTCAISGVMNSLGGFVLTGIDGAKLPIAPVAEQTQTLKSLYGEMVFGVEIGIYPGKLYFSVYNDVIGMVIRQYHNIECGAALKKGVPEMLFSLNGKLLGVNLSVRAFNYNRLVPFIDAVLISSFMNNAREMLPLSEMCNPPDAIGFLGVEYQAVTPALIQSSNIEHLTDGGREGLLVSYVYPGSIAEKIGLKAGDIMLKLILPSGGEPIKLTGKAFGHAQERQFPWQNLDNIPEQYFSEIPEPWKGVKNPLSRQLTNIGINKPVRLIAICNGQAVAKEFVIPAAEPYFEIAPAYRSGTLGVEVRNITFEVRRYFRMGDTGKGVIISDVSAGRAGSVAGLRPFEIITAVNDQVVNNVQEFAQAVSGQSEIRLAVRRLGVNRVVTIKPAMGPRR